MARDDVKRHQLITGANNIFYVGVKNAKVVLRAVVGGMCNSVGVASL